MCYNPFGGDLMHGIIKTMLEEHKVIGYRFKLMLKKNNIEASNGAIFYNLKKFEEQGYVKGTIEGKTKVYVLTDLGKKEFSKNLLLIPKNIEITMQELGSQMPFIDWYNHHDVIKFSQTIEKLNILLKKHVEDIK